MEYVLEEMDMTEFCRVLDKTPFLTENVKEHLVSNFGIFRDGEDGDVHIEQVAKMLFCLVQIVKKIKIDARTVIFPRVQHGQ